MTEQPVGGRRSVWIWVLERDAKHLIHHPTLVSCACDPMAETMHKMIMDYQNGLSFLDETVHYSQSRQTTSATRLNGPIRFLLLLCAAMLPPPMPRV